MPAPGASIVVVTRNRLDSLRIALSSCVAQEYEPLEILVFDDASEDNTSDIVATEFPSVRLLRSEQRKGLIALRSESFRVARGSYVFSLDDDSYYSDPRTVACVVKQFESNPRAGAVAMTYIERRLRDGALLEVRADHAGEAVRSFRGCAHAIRREAALKIGGYRDFFVHQGEERDFSLRLLAAGMDVVQGDNPPVVHLPSLVRDQTRVDYYGVRNQLLFDMLNIPHPWMVPRLFADVLRLLTYKLRWNTAVPRLGYVLAGLAACLRYSSMRQPIARAVYKDYLRRPMQYPRPWRGPLPEPATRGAVERHQ